jgi:trehalose-phosphatase
MNSVINQLKNRNLFLLLDFDGTLAPIAQKPQDAAISAETREVLVRISKECKLQVAVISGRALRDIKQVVAVDGIIYAGNHGMEMEGLDFKFEYPLPRGYRDNLKQIRDTLHQNLAGIEGVFFEDKGYCLCIHYRQVARGKLSFLKDCFKRAISLFVQNNAVKLCYGKKVFEVRPPLEWDKGMAVLWLLERQSVLRPGAGTYPVYIGDDQTDEDAFKALKNTGLTVVVGKTEQSCAQYYLRDTVDVTRFLRQIADAIKS